MRLRISLAVAITMALPVLASADIVNFHDALNYANHLADGDSPTNGSLLFSGQGAYSDPGNNHWNGFSLPGEATWPSPVTSSGTATPITISVTYGFVTSEVDQFAISTADGGGNSVQGMPEFLLGNEASVNLNNPGPAPALPGRPEGTFALHNVPAGSYTLYLYGARADNNGGTNFSLAAANGGAADQGISGTINSGATPGPALADGQSITYVEGANYVVFTDVVPDAGGNISGTFVPNPAAAIGKTGYAPTGSFNGLQLIDPSTGSVPEPTSAAVLGLAGVGLLLGRRRRLG